MPILWIRIIGGIGNAVFDLLNALNIADKLANTYHVEYKVSGTYVSWATNRAYKTKQYFDGHGEYCIFSDVHKILGLPDPTKLEEIFPSLGIEIWGTRK